MRQEFETPVEIIKPEGVSNETLLLVNKALDDIRRLHEQSNFPDKKYYHNCGHTLAVLHRLSKYLDIIERVRPELLVPGTRDCAYLMGAFHDYHQRYQISMVEQDEKKRWTRKRFTWINEIQSAAEVIEQMEGVNDECGYMVYSFEQMTMVGKGIELTTPGWDSANMTVYQPKLQPDTPLILRMLAGVDIGSAAIDGPETAKIESDRLLLEDNLDLAALFLHLPEMTELTPDEAVLMIRQWSQFQVNYLRGRKKRLEVELEGLDTDIKDQLLATLFCHLDESIEYMQKVADERETMDFTQLEAEFMQYLL